ncbi:DUF1345 domain-containing protein [Hymenobacter busanensis]|uniref:DUF1345 domain-containing protein n=1 Tax=Hymenobacter busanensis TaxID=2607656 RepID=A0A7L4ZXN2_9BACT|nr:DUF1345 domain-containing protein [Hymenobacter busanensis]KAA9333323.1 DUF1345 domain-containing protein [Hymenobacter busanensis]QHJ07998.1 DUF1345 domain-containing protein [Hymenobacter busanensis]
MGSASISFRLLRRMGALPALVRLLLGVVAGALAYGWATGSLSPLTRLVAAWDGFALVSLLLLWAAIVTAEVNTIRAVAMAEDPGRLWTSVFVLVTAGASLLAVVALLDTMRTLPHGQLPLYAVLSIVAVGAAWLLVHTVFTLRYAHLYYDTTVDGGEGGLDFPGGETEPDYLDFAYFAFVVGMTAQTADVAISSRYLRRVALLHGIISFGFNTAVVALTVGGLAGVL